MWLQPSDILTKMPKIHTRIQIASSSGIRKRDVHVEKNLIRSLFITLQNISSRFQCETWSIETTERKHGQSPDFGIYFIKLNLYTAKPTVNQGKRKPTEWERNFARYMSDRRLNSRIYQELIPFQNKRPSWPWSWRDSWVVKNICCSYQGPEFNS